MDEAAIKNKVYELVSFIVVSARNLLEEPAHYGPLRLVDTASRLIEIMQSEGLSNDHLSSLRQQIDEGKYSAMGDEEEFKSFLESLVLTIVEQIEDQPE
jgi:hypothetical protein